MITNHMGGFGKKDCEMKSICHLVNQESIILESMILVRNGLALELAVDPKDVRVKLDFVDGVVKPEFLVDERVLAKSTDDGVRKSMAKIWSIVKMDLTKRLNGLTARRYE
jgi:hypothetical protein